MEPRSLHTVRTQKIFSTVSESNSPYKLPQSNQLLSNRPNHRKYKLSHSQVSKIDKLLPEGLARWKERRQIQVDKKSQRFKTNEESEQRDGDEQQEQFVRLKEIKQSASVHKMNYRIKKDNIVNLQNSVSLHVQIISFDLSQKKSPIQQSQQVHSVVSQLQQQQQVICFQVHDQQTSTHFRSQFTYATLSEQVKFMFESLDEMFEYVVNGVESKREQTAKLVRFNRSTMRLQVIVKFNPHTHTQISSSSYNKIKQKVIQVQLLPFAVIEIVDNHHIEDQQKQQLQHKIASLNHQLNQSKELVNILKDENQTLKENLKKYKDEIDKQKAEKQIMMESYDKLSKASQVTKQYQFHFSPDPKAKNYSHFTLKNQILKKIKNDLKWDQVSSQAPLPKAGRHYFSFLIKDFLPDFMFGIVTLKGKDTANAFLGLQTICLYASKNNCHIYERGKHYKLSVNIKRGDVVFVIVDREKGMIEWVKRKGYEQRQGYQSKSKSPQCQQNKDKELQAQNDPYLCSQSGQKMHKQHTEADLHHQSRQRKASQSFSSQILTTHLSMNPPSLPPTNQNQQIEYIHSTEIPEDILAHEIYGYVEVYNVDEPLKLNEKKKTYNG